MAPQNPLPIWEDRKGDPGMSTAWYLECQAICRAGLALLLQRGLECGLGDERGQTPDQATHLIPWHPKARIASPGTPGSLENAPRALPSSPGSLAPDVTERPEPSALGSPQIRGWEPAGPAGEARAVPSAKCFIPACLPYRRCHLTGGAGAPLWGPGATVAEARTDCPFWSRGGGRGERWRTGTKEA